jgi:hypothetical protein
MRLTDFASAKGVRAPPSFNGLISCEGMPHSFPSPPRSRGAEEPEFTRLYNYMRRSASRGAEMTHYPRRNSYPQLLPENRSKAFKILRRD